MTDKATLLALADRVEALEGPCRGTDLAIATLTRAPQPTDKWFGRRHAKRARAYTALIDAAITLVKDGWHFSVATVGVGQLGACALTRDNDGGSSFTGVAYTPALALTAAALRARAGGVE